MKHPAAVLMAGAIGYPIAVMQEQDRGFAFTVPLPPFSFSALRTGPAYRRHRAPAFPMIRNLWRSDFRA